MARVRPFRRLEIDALICAKISRIMQEERYRGSFTSRVENILDLFGDGLLRDIRELPVFTSNKKGEKIATAAGAEQIEKHGKQRKAS